jgi:hypothetical protein
MKLFLWVIFSLISAQIIHHGSRVFREGFHSSLSNSHSALLSQYSGGYPEQPLLLDTKGTKVIYAPSGKTEISDNTAADIWWHYPIFNVGSFAQLTNNLKYPKNPDDGKCTPASMCQTLYLDRVSGPPNEIYPLPPVVEKAPDSGFVRVNYYNGKR